MPETEITEEKLKHLLSTSTEHITEFIIKHPEIIYKGVPLIIAIYILSPAVIVIWHWLPWLWATYEVYRRIPQGIVPIAISIWKDVLQSN